MFCLGIVSPLYGFALIVSRCRRKKKGGGFKSRVSRSTEKLGEREKKRKVKKGRGRQIYKKTKTNGQVSEYIIYNIYIYIYTYISCQNVRTTCLFAPNL